MQESSATAKQPIPLPASNLPLYDSRVIVNGGIMPLETATEHPFGNLNRQVGKMLDQMQKGFFPFSPGEVWTPNVNLYENDRTYLVCVDLAGVVKEEIDVQVTRGVLTLRGVRAVPVPTSSSPENDGAAQPRYRVHLMEIDHGQFSREVELPLDVIQDQINATYRNGMLWIELPKK